MPVGQMSCYTQYMQQWQKSRARNRSRGSSSPGFCSVLLLRGRRHLEASAHTEGKVLPGLYTYLSRHYDAGDNTKADLRKDKPAPVNLLVEQRINQLDKAMD